MAIPSSPFGKPRVRKPSALHLFTNRVSERESLRVFFNKIAAVGGCLDRPVLSFYGVGGIGKTILLKIAAKELDASGSILRLVSLDVDHDRWKRSSSVGEFFWHLRERLDIPTPLFDYLYFALWRDQHPGESCNLRDGIVQTLVKDCGEGGNLISTLTTYLHGGGAIGSIAHFLDKAASAFRDRARRAGLEEIGIVVEELTAKQLETHLPSLLHRDLASWMHAHTNAAMCVAIDGFERIQSTVAADDIQKSFVDFCGYCTDPDDPSGRYLGFLLLGREHLRWGELYDKEWNERIDSHFIAGISGADALEFFGRAAEYHRQEGDNVVADLLRTHEDALLMASREHRHDEQTSSYHPYYLDLAYDLVRDRREAFQASDVGDSPKELQIRFLRYLQTDHDALFNAFQCFALAGTFDAMLFGYLVEYHQVATGLNFSHLVGDDFSFVDEVPSAPGKYRLHRLMERALIDTQSTKAENRAAALERIHRILTYFIGRSTCVTVEDFSADHLDAYRQGMTVLFARYVDGFLDIDSLIPLFFQLDTAILEGQARVVNNLEWYQKLLSVVEEKDGPEDDATLSNITIIALLLQRQGKLEDAKSLLLRVLTVQKRLLGEEHPDTLQSNINLAGLLAEQGNLAEAEAAYRHALKIQERLFAPEHSDILSTGRLLASLLGDKGDFAEAESLSRRLFEVREQRLGPEHPDTLSSIDNWAQQLLNQAKVTDAELLFRRVLSARKHALGSDHSDTLGSINNLAYLLSIKGEIAEAEMLYRHVLRIEERMFGPDDRATLSAINNLASILLDKKDFDGAELLYRRVLESRERIFGVNHLDTLSCANDLASLLYEKGDIISAEPLSRRAFLGYEQLLGLEHPTTSAIAFNLANLLNKKGDYASAEPLYRHVLDRQQRLIGRDHVNTLSVVSNLANVLFAQRDFAGAEPLMLRLTETWDRLHGPDHPNAVVSLIDLSRVLVAQGKLVDAEPVCRRLLKVREQMLSAEDPATLRAMSELGSLLQAKGDAEEAELLYRRALTIQWQQSGSSHDDTLFTISELAFLLGAKGEFVEAEHLYSILWVIHEQKFGPDDPRTSAAVRNLFTVISNQDGSLDGVALSRRVMEARERLLSSQSGS